MAKRSQRREIARETLGILETGHYHNAAGRRVDISAAMKAAKKDTLLYYPTDFPGLFVNVRRTLGESEKFATRFEVRNETTFSGALRLIEEGYENVVALNFASAKNPGGGFLNGSQAQEESLARASGLYPTLLEAREYYDANRAFRSSLYTDHLIYSPDVPVFRDDADELLDEAYLLSFITSPAPNRGALEKNNRGKLHKIEPAFRQRMAQVLAVAVDRGHDGIVLGAWGCGVFRNDPHDVARWFKELLAPGGDFAGAFKKVVFSVLDGHKNTERFDAFHSVFQNL